MQKLSMEAQNRKTVAEFKRSEKTPVIAVLENIRSAYNVGSVFRTSDAFLLEGVYLTGYTAKPPHKEIKKTALGAEETVEWKHFKTTGEAIEDLRSKKYDVFAQSSDSYAHAYPFIEIGLGFAYLSYFIPALTYAITMIIMAISAFSVLRALRAGLDVECACLGTVLNVPLSTVSLIENIGMGIMAALMLLAAIY